MQSFYIRSPIVKIGLGILSVLLAVAAVLYIGLREEARMEAQTLNWEARRIENGAVIYKNNCGACHGADGRGLPNVAPALNSHYFFVERATDVGWTGTLRDFVALTVAAGRPSNAHSQWANRMPTWGEEYGGPLRNDQIEQVVSYVMNWQESALAQTAAEDPWQCFQDVPKPCEEQTIGDVIVVPVPEEITGPRSPEQLYVDMGCAGCHNLDQPETDTIRGTVGPNLGNLTENAAQRIEGMNAAEYIHESIVNPGHYVVPGYVGGIMPQNFHERMSEEEIESLVEWLLETSH
jgi:mono/diheme cytochrome c family protein